MTIVIALNLGHFVLIIADCRMSKYNPYGNVENYEDTYEKIFKTKIGLISGGGNQRLIDMLKQQLTLRPVKNLDETLEGLRSIRSRFPNDTDRLKDTECVLTNYSTLERKLKLTRTNFLMEKMVDYPDKPPISPFPLLLEPLGATEMQKKEMLEYLKTHVKTLKRYYNWKDCARDHAMLAGEFIQEKSKLYDSVSKSFQIGIHRADGFIGVTKIITDISDLDWNIRLII